MCQPVARRLGWLLNTRVTNTPIANKQAVAGSGTITAGMAIAASVDNNRKVASVSPVANAILSPSSAVAPETSVIIIRAAAWSSDGKLLASGGWDQSIKIWDTIAGREIRTLDGHSSKIRDVAFAPDSKRMVSSDWSGAVKLWDVLNGEALLTPLQSDSNKTGEFGWSRNGATLWRSRTWQRDGEWVWELSEARPQILDAGRGYEMVRSGELDTAVARRSFAEGLRLAMSDRLEESDRAFESAERFVGPQAWARRQRATIFREKGLTARAVEDLTIASQVAVDQPEAKNELALLLANRYDNQVRQPRRAEIIARELLVDWPEQCEFWMTLALAQYRQGKWRGAIDSLDRATQHAWHQQPGIDLLRALALARLGKTTEAKQSLHKSSENWDLYTYFQDHGGPVTAETADRLRKEAGALISGTAVGN